MLIRLASLILDFSTAQEADRLIRNRGHGALATARHAVRAADEGSRTWFWTRVLAQVEVRPGCRPW